MKMYNFNLKSLLLAVVCLIALDITAKENVGQKGKTAPHKSNKTAANCSPANSRVDLDINNVRTKLLSGGDMWWDLNDAKYEIPKVEPGSGEVSVHSLFAGALWIGGIDQGGQLRVAAQTYRQTGNDFWPGPLDQQGTVDEETCSKFDYHWKVNRTDINDFIQTVESNGGSVSEAQVPRSILEWPGRGNPYAVGNNGELLNLSASKSMAPFVDLNNNNIYDPLEGDYPDVPGDQAIWWIYNDAGNTHTETGGEMIGLEIKSLAFAFSTNDEINDMTFYQFDIENYSTSILDSVYFGQWVDADLGYAFDDYVGCDPSRALGICYNGDPLDQTAAGYGSNPPIVGVDFFKGPKKYIYSGGAIVDSVLLGMSKFVYYDNNFTITGNPENASHFYGYLSGTWKNGSPFTFGGNGYQTGVPTNYMFPDDPGSGGWSECDEGNVPFDRRFVQSSGPFRLEPGAKNEVIVGVVWVRPTTQTGCLADFDALRIADDKAQALFDNNFELIDGPDAPDLIIRELDQQIIISLTNNPAISNNVQESYSESDPVIKNLIDSADATATVVGDSVFRFQGYKIFQLKNSQVSASEFTDPDRSRLIAQVDVEDNVTKLVNFTFDPNLGADVPSLMVNGNNEGIKKTFSVTEDAFATGDKTLVNHKTYYFGAVSYAHNYYHVTTYNTFIDSAGDPVQVVDDVFEQRQPYLEGRGNIKIYSAIPHKPAPESGGLALNTRFGEGPEIQRLDGKGNGGNILELTQDALFEAESTNFSETPFYQKNLGPVDIRIFDPVKVPNAEFEMVFYDTTGATTDILSADAKWYLKNLATQEMVHAERPIGEQGEQIIPKWGLVVNIQQVELPGGRYNARNNGFIGAEKVYADPDIRWLTSTPDQEGESILNWIRSGSSIPNNTGSSYQEFQDYYRGAPNNVDYYYDEDQVYEDVLDGTWAPAALVGGIQTGEDFMPYPENLFLRNDFDWLANTQSVQIVLTSDTTKWSKCAVVEMSDDNGISEGQRSKLQLRSHASWTGKVDANGNPVYSTTDEGRSYFPGYAVNLETGERINIIFSENSFLKGENGDDMIWNPTARLTNPAGPGGTTFLLGGMHYVYIINTPYDGGKSAQEELSKTGLNNIRQGIRNIFENAVWVSTTMLSQDFELKPISEGIIPTETNIKLWVGRPYEKFTATGKNNGMPMYFFSTDGLAPDTNNLQVAKDALDMIRVVPNPYYAYSEYERSQLDNRVKITNLPPSCTITIYSTDGTLIRRIQREVPSNVSSGEELSKTNFDTSVDWDLRNNENIPIASGMYLIHINAPGVGEKVVKWFGVMRPVNLDTF